MEEAREGCPQDLEFSDHVFCLAFSPSQDVIASGLITGEVNVHRYSADHAESLLSLNNLHSKATRCLSFTSDGSGLFTASKDRSINLLELNGQKVMWKQTPPQLGGSSHQHPISAMLANGTQLFTGDDEGVIKMWDLRSKDAVRTFTENEDFIGDMILHKGKLVCGSGDGTLAVYDIRKGTLYAMSDNMEDELLSLALLKNGTKLVCGSQGGVLNIFSWDDWGDVSDRFPGHPESIDTIVTLTDEVILTGSSDGLIRVINIHPNKLLGVIGEHDEFPVERLSLSRDESFLASCSHDCTVKFWNIKFLFEDSDEEEKKEDGEELDSDSDSDSGFGKKKENGSAKLQSTLLSEDQKQLTKFFSDL